MTSRTLPGCLAREIVGLTELSRDALVDRWIAFYDKPPLRTRTKDLLVRAIAYEIQVEALGGLLATEKIALSAVAGGKTGKPADDLKPGTRLYRSWQGVTQEVLVFDGSYSWHGKSYGSLSEVARAITGSRWSGPKFFGVRA